MNQCLGWQPSLRLCFRHCTARCLWGGHDLPTYKTYSQEHLNRDLSAYLEPSAGLADFNGKYPSDFIAKERPDHLPAWHLVGGLDLLSDTELTGDEPDDGILLF